MHCAMVTIQSEFTCVTWYLGWEGASGEEKVNLPFANIVALIPTDTCFLCDGSTFCVPINLGSDHEEAGFLLCCTRPPK